MFQIYGMAAEEETKAKEFFEELDIIVNRTVLYDLAHDGILYNEERATAGPCECFTLASGRPYCWDKGIIGALNQEQIARFCPPEKRVARQGGIPNRIQQFVEASQACEIGKTFDNREVTNLQTRLECMSKEASKRGIKI